MNKKIRKYAVCILLLMLFVCILFSLPQYFWKNPAPKESSTVPVLYVVDGDTIDVFIDGKSQRVRLIGINAPEEYPKEKKECFADEASIAMKQLVNGKQVILVADQTQDDRDVYRRLLRYIILPDGTNVNLEMITHGFAREYTFNVPYQKQSIFREAQEIAKTQAVGLWNACKKN